MKFQKYGEKNYVVQTKKIKQKKHLIDIKFNIELKMNERSS